MPVTWTAPSAPLEVEEEVELVIVEEEEEIGTAGVAGAGFFFDGIFFHITLHQRPRGYVVKLNGLPFRASEREIEDWLAEAADPLEVVIEMDRLANHRNGWKTFLIKGWESGTH